MAIPRKDSLLFTWSNNLQEKITAEPGTYFVQPGTVTQYTNLNTIWAEAYTAASVTGARSKALVAARNTAKKNLLDFARQLYAQIQSNAQISDAAKELAGVHVRKPEPTPAPIPTQMPNISIISVIGRTIKVRLHSDEPGKRGKPANVKGASVFSFVGNEPSEDISQWKFEGSTGKTEFTVTFPSTLSPGTKVWLTAFWFNNRNQSGPACAPLQAYVSYNGFSLIAA